MFTVITHAQVHNKKKVSRHGHGEDGGDLKYIMVILEFANYVRLHIDTNKHSGYCLIVYSPLIVSFVEQNKKEAAEQEGLIVGRQGPFSPLQSLNAVSENRWRQGNRFNLSARIVQLSSTSADY